MPAPALDYGVYTPALVAGANVSAVTPAPCQWMRVGQVVTVSGQITVTITLVSTATTVNIPLPVPSAFSAAGQCGGGAESAGTAGASAAIAADPTTGQAQVSFISFATGAQTLSFTFTYLVV